MLLNTGTAPNMNLATIMRINVMCCKRSYKDTVHSATMSLLIKQVSFEVFPQGGDG